eukprot:scaffold177739_cov25-Prasinocladus_malaysianus.AAC.1
MHPCLQSKRQSLTDASSSLNYFLSNIDTTEEVERIDSIVSTFDSLRVGALYTMLDFACRAYA